MSKTLGIVLTVVIIFGVVGYLFWDSHQKKMAELEAKPTRATAPEPAFRLSVQQLSDAYEINEVEADKKYKDKIIRIAGFVVSIEKDIASRPYIILANRKESPAVEAQCFIKSDCATKASELRPGDQLVIQGVGHGKVGRPLLYESTFGSVDVLNNIQWSCY
jgi:hypothetical protein